ncbi:uncharacterized protein LOC119308299 isoform X1 [Triticum dicoccoides]|uniref:uncharacterized protein LOC119308299 isoform X1 n=1 Tax=Triticum dicoccoides TaxID=85692 RepID=UPI00188E95C1|nr:uncharacterized protein LOC119308299 isoform X1 [Triticum dicoccoides]
MQLGRCPLCSSVAAPVQLGCVCLSFSLTCRLGERGAAAEERSHGKGRCGRTGLHRRHLQFTPCKMRCSSSWPDSSERRIVPHSMQVLWSCSSEMLAMPFRACARAVRRAPSLPIGRWTMAVQLGDALHVVLDLCVCSRESAISISSRVGFWRYLLKKNLDARWLQGFPCAVFAIGDSGYQGLLQRSSVQGFHSLVQNRSVIGLGDDQDSSGYEKALGPWLLSFWKSLNRTNPSLLPRIQARPRALRQASKHSYECPCTSAPLPQTFRKKRIPLVWKMDSSRIYSSQWLYAAFNFSV